MSSAATAEQQCHWTTTTADNTASAGGLRRPGSRDSGNTACMLAAAECAQAKRGASSGMTVTTTADAFTSFNKKQVTILEPFADDLPSAARRRRQRKNVIVDDDDDKNFKTNDGDYDNAQKCQNIAKLSMQQQQQQQPTAALLHMVANKLQQHFTALPLPPLPPPSVPSSSSALSAKLPQTAAAAAAIAASSTTVTVSPAHSIDRTASDNDSGCPLEEYAWVPAGLRPDLVHKYFSAFSEEQIPYINSAGEKLRVRTLLHQLPPHDNDLRYCHHLLDEQQRGEMRRFIAQRKQLALGRATVKVVHAPPSSEQHNGRDGGASLQQCCKHCRGTFNKSGGGGGALGVFAARDGPNACWHPQCFRCAQCEELLVDLIYFHNNNGSGTGDNRIYCGRHHAVSANVGGMAQLTATTELWKPRCAACDEIIFSDDCTEAENNTWHPQHFCCSQCDIALGGQRYICREQRPYCVACYEMLFSRMCTACKQIISVEQLQVSHDSRHWHAHEQCFRCRACGVSLINRHFLPKGDSVFCSSKCVQQQQQETPLFSSSCSLVDSVTAKLPLEAIEEEEDEIPPQQQFLGNNLNSGSTAAAAAFFESSRVVPGSASVRRSASQRYIDSIQQHQHQQEQQQMQQRLSFSINRTQQDEEVENVENQNTNAKDNDENLANIYVNLFPLQGACEEKGSNIRVSIRSSGGGGGGGAGSRERTPVRILPTPEINGIITRTPRFSSSSSANQQLRRSSNVALSAPSFPNTDDDLPRVAAPPRAPRTSAAAAAHSESLARRATLLPPITSSTSDDDEEEQQQQQKPQLHLPNRISSLRNFPPLQLFPPTALSTSSAKNSVGERTLFQAPMPPPPPIPVRHPHTALTPTLDRRRLFIIPTLSSSDVTADAEVSPYSVGNATMPPSLAATTTYPSSSLTRIHHRRSQSPAAPYFTTDALMCPPRLTGGGGPAQQASSCSEVGIDVYRRRQQLLQQQQQQQHAVSQSLLFRQRQPLFNAATPQPTPKLSHLRTNQFAGAVGGVHINTVTCANDSGNWLAPAAPITTTPSHVPHQQWASHSQRNNSTRWPKDDDYIYSVGCLGGVGGASRRRRGRKNKLNSNDNNNSNAFLVNSGNAAAAMVCVGKTITTTNDHNKNNGRNEGRCVVM